MPVSPNIARLKKLLDDFTVTAVTATTLTATTGTITTLTVSDTLTVSGKAENVPVVALSAVKSLVGAAGNYDLEFTQPADTTILEFGITAAQSTDVAGNYTLDLGTTAGGAELIASTQVVSTNTWDANEGISTGGLLGESDVAMVFNGSDPEYHTATERTLTCRVVTPAGTNTTGTVRGWIRFIYM